MPLVGCMLLLLPNRAFVILRWHTVHDGAITDDSPKRHVI
jgi:hypothetical protein